MIALGSVPPCSSPEAREIKTRMHTHKTEWYLEQERAHGCSDSDLSPGA